MFSCFEKPQTFFEKPFYEEIDFGGNWRSNIGTIPGFLEIEKYKKHFFNSRIERKMTTILSRLSGKLLTPKIHYLLVGQGRYSAHKFSLF